MRKIKWGIFIASLAIVCLAGCQLEKKADIEKSDSTVNSTGKIYKVKVPKYDLEQIVDTFLGKSVEETVREGAEQEENYYYFENREENFVLAESMDGAGVVVEYRDYFENTGIQYEMALDNHDHMKNVVDYGLRKYYPQESIDACSKEEVISYCSRYAEVLGYGKAEASVYAMTLENLQSVMEEYPEKGAPIPNYERSQKADEFDYLENPQKWTKEHEALLVVYRPYINEMLMDSRYQILQFIYVPKYKKIVYAQGTIPWKTEQPEEVELIAASEAVSKVILKNGVSKKEDIVVQEPKLVYSLNITQLNKEKAVCLCWRVDYELKNSAAYTGDRAFQTMLVDAVTGDECQMFDIK